MIHLNILIALTKSALICTLCILLTKNYNLFTMQLLY